MRISTSARRCRARACVGVGLVGLVLAGASGSVARAAVVSAAQPAGQGVPAAPTGLVATAADPGEVTLSWAAPSSSGISPVTSYDIYVATTPAFRGGEPAFASARTSVVVADLHNGTTYYFAVAAVNAQGAGPVSETVSAVPAAQVPGPPTHAIAQPGRTRVILMWVAPAATGGAKISGYVIYAGTRPGGESGTPVSHGLVHDTAYAVMGLASGTTYYFKVAAVDAAGHQGALSAEVSAIPWPAAPTGQGQGQGPTSQGQGQGPAPSRSTAPTQGQGGGQQQSQPVTQATDLTQARSPGTQAGVPAGAPDWMIIALAAVAAAAFYGAIAIAVHLRRMRARQGGTGQAPAELRDRPLAGSRYR